MFLLLLGGTKLFSLEDWLADGVDEDNVELEEGLIAFTGCEEGDEKEEEEEELDEFARWRFGKGISKSRE